MYGQSAIEDFNKVTTIREYNEALRDAVVCFGGRRDQIEKPRQWTDAMYAARMAARDRAMSA